MRHRSSIVQSIIILFVVLSNTACMATPVTPVIADGQIMATASGSTLWGISQALTFQPGTSILTDPNGKLVIFTWPVQGTGIAWAQMKNAAGGFKAFFTATQGKGSIANYQTWTVLKGYLDEGKWVMATPGILSSALIAEITAAAATAVAVSFTSMPSIIMVPMVPLQNVLDEIFQPTSS